MKRVSVGAIALLVAVPGQAQLVPMNDSGLTFGHVHLNVTDMDRDRRLWSELFGGEWLDGTGRPILRVPGALIFFNERETTVRSVGTAIDHVGFKVRDMDGVLDTWRSLGYEVDNDFMGGEGLRQAYITMPDGARIELVGDPAQSARTEMHHVHFYSPRNEAVLAWYLDLLGGTQRARGTIQHTTDVPGSNLSFNSSDEEVATSAGTAFDHVGFEVEDMDAFLATLARHGVELEREPFYVESLDVRVAFFVDPGGARIEITEGLAKY